jgi:hypothetical protein
MFPIKSNFKIVKSCCYEKSFGTLINEGNNAGFAYYSTTADSVFLSRLDMLLTHYYFLIIIFDFFIISSFDCCTGDRWEKCKNFYKIYPPTDPSKNSWEFKLSKRI